MKFGNYWKKSDIAPCFPRAIRQNLAALFYSPTNYELPPITNGFKSPLTPPKGEE